MARQAIDVTSEVARLSALTIFELRNEWRQRYRLPPPMRISRDLLIRGITYKLQERSLGGLSPSDLRKLQRFSGDAESNDVRKPTPIILRPGVRLVREWRGVTHTVDIHADGLEWNGRRFASLSVIAREITGAHWSGPRFFGLKKDNRAVGVPDSIAELDDAQA